MLPEETCQRRMTLPASKQPAPLSFTRHYLPVFLLSVVLRLGFSYFAPAQYLTFGDTAEYIETGRRFCALGRYPFEHIALPTFRAPGFPVFLALLSWCFLLPAWWLQWSLAILDSCACLLGMGIVSYLSRQQHTARAMLFGLGYGSYPLFVQESISVQSEALTLSLLLAALLMFVKAQCSESSCQAGSRIGSSRHSFLAGVLAGLAILVRPPALIVLFPLTMAVFLVPKGNRSKGCLALLGLVLTVFSWSIYATGRTGKLTLVNDSFCYSVYRGSRPELMAVYSARDLESFSRAAEQSESVIRDAEARIEGNGWCGAALALMREDPAIQARLALLKLWAFFRPWPHRGAHRLTIVVLVGSTVILLYSLFLAFLFQDARGKGERILKGMLVAYIVLVALSHVPHQVSNRYRVPLVDPVMMIVVAAFLRLEVPAQFRSVRRLSE